MSRIAMLAPPWIPVPAPGYGGIEEVVRLLSRGLAARGHDVTLFAPPGSDSAADVVPVLERPHPEDIEHSVIEATHVGLAFDLIDHARRCGRPFDVVHDHCPGVALAMADRLTTPVVHTMHGPFDAERAELYRRHGQKATLVAISQAQRRQAPDGVDCAAVVPNPIDVDEWPLREVKEDWLLFVGRMDPDKGPDRAIDAAARARRPLVLAGPVQPEHRDYFAAAVEPRIDGDRVRYVGTVDGADRANLFARAQALLMPIEWDEPFGLVMVEALSTGTPVIAFAHGAASEIVDDGRTGFLVSGVDEMAHAIGNIGEIDPGTCRSAVAERFGLPKVLELYEATYVAASRSHRDQPVANPSAPSTALEP